MFIPEYSITDRALKNIATIEYSKAVVDNTTLLRHWQRKLEKEAKITSIYNYCADQQRNFSLDKIKAYFEKFDTAPNKTLDSYLDVIDLIDQTTDDLDIERLKYIQKITGVGENLRTKNLPYKVLPDEILARLTDLFNWYKSHEAKDTHPIIASALFRGEFDTILPFEENNNLLNDVATEWILKYSGYGFSGYLCSIDYLNRTKREYEQRLNSIYQFEQDFTAWIEYFSDGLAFKSVEIKERVLLLAKDTKVAKAAGRHKLTPRQERIIEYLNDYGIMQNRDFVRVFPDISEDSILRDLKALVNLNIITKTGSTKSSRYQLN